MRQQRWPRTVILAMSAAVMVGCGNPGVTGIDQVGQLRVLNVAPGAPNLDVLVDGQRVLTNVQFRNASEFALVGAGSHAVEFRESGTGNVMFTMRPVVPANGQVTLLALGSAGQFRGMTLNDTTGLVPEDGARFRIVNALPAATGLNLFFGNQDVDFGTATPRLTDIPFGTASTFLDVPAGLSRFGFTTASGQTVTLDEDLILLDIGSVRTFVVTPTASGGAELIALDPAGVS